jgi:methyl-accepting chemotaxis protein
MDDDALRRDRRSTRVAISIPIVIYGVDAEGKEFSEAARTLVVNKHGGKIATTQRLVMGADVRVENRALGVEVKATVTWLGEKRNPGDLLRVGLQLKEAQNVWGIAFPPDDWRDGPREEELPAPIPQTGQPPIDFNASATPVSSLAAEELTIRLLQELQEAADAHAREFQVRLKELTQRVGMELELDLRERAAHAKAREVGALELEIGTLRASLREAREEVTRLETEIQELKSSLDATLESPALTSLPEARRQLSALANSIVESMNRAANPAPGHRA